MLLLGPPGVGKTHLGHRPRHRRHRGRLPHLLHLRRRHGARPPVGAPRGHRPLQDAHLHRALGAGHRRARLPARSTRPRRTGSSRSSAAATSKASIVLTSNRGFARLGPGLRRPGRGQRHRRPPAPQRHRRQHPRPQLPHARPPGRTANPGRGSRRWAVAKEVIRLAAPAPDRCYSPSRSAPGLFRFRDRVCSDFASAHRASPNP